MSNKIINGISILFCAVGGLILLWIQLVERFNNADLTETELFLKFWQQFLLAGILLIAGYFGMLKANS